MVMVLEEEEDPTGNVESEKFDEKIWKFHTEEKSYKSKEVQLKR